MDLYQLGWRTLPITKNNVKQNRFRRCYFARDSGYFYRHTTSRMLHICKTYLLMPVEKLFANIKRKLHQTISVHNSHQLVLEKRRVRRKWQVARAPEDKNPLNNLTSRLNRGIMKLKKYSVNKYVSEITDNQDTEYSLWKVTKNLSKWTTHIPALKTGK